MAFTPPKRIALLEHAYSPGFMDPQRHFVEHPVKQGLQACLIEERQPNGTAIKIIDALTILPASVAYKVEGPDPLYACWLGVIANFYAVSASKLSGCKEVIKLAGTKAETHPPFRSSRHHMLAGNIIRMFGGTAGVMSKPASASLSDWNDVQTSLEEANCWYMQHRKTDEARLACEDQWRILMAWERWEKANLSWGERFLAHRQKSPGRVNPAKVRGRTNKVSNNLSAFEKRCRHIGLRLGNMPAFRLVRPYGPRMFAY